MAEPTDVLTAATVLETKLRRPTGTRLLVARTRLLDQVSASSDSRLILVSAPAGYGKTALISQWLESVNTPYAWLSLDEHDNDLATFLLYLMAAIRTVYQESMAAIELLLETPTFPTPSRLADALVHDLATLPGALTLALDDYHTLHVPEIHALMARLLGHLPSHVHLVLITRADPPLPLERLRGRQQLGEIRAEDLRFSAAETRLLLQQLLGPEVTEETAALLEDSTEGWAVGLHLAALSMRNQTDPVAFAHKIAQHGHQSVAQYLLSEVLGGLPENQRLCLLQTSLLDRFCAPLIDVIQAEGGEKLTGDDFVRTIRRDNLFVVSLDDEGTWFRYHHFFRSLLRVRLRQRYTGPDINAMHARASAWFAAHGWMGEAIGHALHAGDPAGAACLVEAQVHPALDREDWRQIEHWIGLLPAEVTRRPKLLLAQAWLHHIRWQVGAIETWLEAAEQIMDAEPATVRGVETVLRGEIDALRAAMAQNRGDSNLTVQWSEAAIAALPPEMRYVTGIAYFYYIWGLQASGQYEKAVDFAHRQLEACGWQPHALTLRLFLALANIHYEMVNVPAIQDLVPIWQKVVDQSGLKLSVAWLRFTQGWLHYQRNELEAADEFFHRFADLAWAAHGRAVVDGYTGLVLTALARGCPDEASLHVNALNERLSERNLLALVAIVQTLGQRVALAAGSPSALEWRPLAGVSPATYDLWEQPVLTDVRSLVATGRPEDLVQAAELLAESRAKAVARHSNRKLIEIGALEALVQAASGDEAAALAVLRDTVERAAPGGALRLLVDCGPGLIGLLQTLKAGGTAPRYIQRLLAVFTSPAAAPSVSANQPEVATAVVEHAVRPELLTNREIDVLTLLAERLSDKEIAERLVLSPVTVKKHTHRIYRKLGVHGRRAAVSHARRLGLI